MEVDGAPAGHGKHVGACRPRRSRGPVGARDPLVDRCPLETTARVLDLPPERIEPDRPLFHLGLDSLMAAELRTAVRVELGVEIPIVELLEDLSMRSLAVAGLGALEGDGRHR